MKLTFYYSSRLLANHAYFNWEAVILGDLICPTSQKSELICPIIKTKNGQKFTIGIT